MLGLITWANVGLGLVARAINTWFAPMNCSTVTLQSLPCVSILFLTRSPWQVYEPHVRHAPHRCHLPPLRHRCCRCRSQSAAAPAPAPGLYCRFPKLHLSNVCALKSRALQVCLASIVIVGVASSLVRPFSLLASQYSYCVAAGRERAPRLHAPLPRRGPATFLSAPALHVTFDRWWAGGPAAPA